MQQYNHLHLAGSSLRSVSLDFALCGDESEQTCVYFHEAVRNTPWKDDNEGGA